MDRRELLTRMGGLVATALGGATLAAPAMAAGPTPQAWLADQDRQARAVRGLRLPSDVQRYLARRGLSPSLIGDAFAALSGVSAWRDLPRETRQDPAVRDRLAQDGQTLGRSLLYVTGYLESLGAQERAASGQLLHDDPALVGLLSASIQGEGAALDADPARLAQLQRVLGRVTWRLSRQSPDLLIDDCVDTADRLAQRAGLARSGNRSGAADWSPAARGVPDTAPGLTSAERQERQLTGEIVKHMGQIVCLFGLMAGGVSVGSLVLTGSGFSLLGLTAAALILVVGLVMIIVGSIVNNP